MVVWDYKNAMFLSKFNHLVNEQRSGADLFYFDRGDKIDVAADEFSNQVRALIAEHGGANSRLGVDKIMIHGMRALEAQGFDVIPGEELTEKARSIKGPDEILAKRPATRWRMQPVQVCQTGICPKMTSGQSCMQKISFAAANGSKPACFLPVHAPTRGFKNVARVYRSHQSQHVAP